MTLFAALVANAALLAAVVCLALDEPMRSLALLALAVALVGWLARVRADARYRQVIAAGAATMLLAGLLTAWAWWQDQAAWAPWLAAGLACAALGAGIQGRGIGRGARFNHNDRYHLLQALALGLWYLAATAGPV